MPVGRVETLIDLADVPVTIEAHEDKRGYALIITADDARIGNGQHELVDTLLVRIARGDVPRTGHTHAARVNDAQTRTVEVASASIDETGRVFVTDRASGENFPAADKQ